MISRIDLGAATGAVPGLGTCAWGGEDWEVEFGWEVCVLSVALASVFDAGEEEDFGCDELCLR